LTGGPVQPLAFGVMTYVTVPVAELSGLVSVSAGIVLVPLVVNPVIAAPVDAVHSKIVEATSDVRVTNDVLVPEQIV